MMATCLQNEVFVKFLLMAGADPWKKTKRHRTFALWLAGKNQNIEIMRDLMGIEPESEANQFRVVVDLAAQRVTLWHNGLAVDESPISSGRKSHPTPKGRYLVTNKYEKWVSTLYGAKMPYFLRLSCSDFGLHAGNLPGYPASHGCIRLPKRFAQKLYETVHEGTLVEIE